jgi:hypothetical protein
MNVLAYGIHEQGLSGSIVRCRTQRLEHDHGNFEQDSFAGSPRYVYFQIKYRLLSTIGSAAEASTFDMSHR